MFVCLKFMNCPSERNFEFKMGADFKHNWVTVTKIFSSSIVECIFSEFEFEFEFEFEMFKFELFVVHVCCWREAKCILQFNQISVSSSVEYRSAKCSRFNPFAIDCRITWLNISLELIWPWQSYPAIQKLGFYSPIKYVLVADQWWPRDLVLSLGVKVRKFPLLWISIGW